jgi:hypothetical protein
MPTRAQVEKLVSEYGQQVKLEHRLYYGRRYGDEPRRYWYVKGFGEHESSKVGDNLAEAYRTMRRWVYGEDVDS